MKITLKPEVKQFSISAGTDNTADDAVFGIRVATEGDHIALASYFQKREMVYLDDAEERVLRSEFNPRVVQMRATYLTLSYIRGLSDEAGNELFRSNTHAIQGERVNLAMTDSQFEAAWSLLPVSIVDAITTAVYAVNPDFTV